MELNVQQMQTITSGRGEELAQQARQAQDLKDAGVKPIGMVERFGELGEKAKNWLRRRNNEGEGDGGVGNEIGFNKTLGPPEGLVPEVYLEEDRQAVIDAGAGEGESGAVGETAQDVSGDGGENENPTRVVSGGDTQEKVDTPSVEGGGVEVDEPGGDGDTTAEIDDSPGAGGDGEDGAPVETGPDETHGDQDEDGAPGETGADESADNPDGGEVEDVKKGEGGTEEIFKDLVALVEGVSDDDVRVILNVLENGELPEEIAEALNGLPGGEVVGRLLRRALEGMREEASRVGDGDVAKGFVEMLKDNAQVLGEHGSDGETNPDVRVESVDGGDGAGGGKDGEKVAREMKSLVDELKEWSNSPDGEKAKKVGKVALLILLSMIMPGGMIGALMLSKAVGLGLGKEPRMAVASVLEKMARVIEPRDASRSGGGDRSGGGVGQSQPAVVAGAAG